MAVATATKQWTLEELHSLPDDGNKYELVRGALLVTPPPSEDHETIAARLSRILDAYVAAHDLGFVYHPRAVVRFEGSEVEPDLMVRRGPLPNRSSDWDASPVPILIVEIQSGSTRRRDQNEKRRLYLDAGVAEYWIVDPERRTVTTVRQSQKDVVSSDTLVWTAEAVAIPLTIDLADVFGAA